MPGYFHILIQAVLSIHIISTAGMMMAGHRSEHEIIYVIFYVDEALALSLYTVCLFRHRKGADVTSDSGAIIFCAVVLP